MKIIFRSAVLAALILTTSCGKDDDSSSSNQVDEQTELLEQTPLDANIVSDNVLIEGSTKEDGAAPAPNGAISLDLSTTSKTAFLGEGFDISLNSDGDVTGAYLRFKAEDGTAADSYYDINIDSNSLDNKSSKKSKSKRSRSNALVAKIDDATLDVDFNATVEPGTFCYELCVYDAQGNISNPQEVCLTVESWGGFSAAVGNWTMTKEEETKEDGSIATHLLGEQDCDIVEEYDCNGGGTFESSGNCVTINEEKLIINADGTYTYKYDEDYKYLNTTQSKEDCEAIFNDDSYILNSYGQWAYIAEDDNLVFIELSYEFLASDGSGQLESETHEIGNAEVLFDDEVKLNGNSLIGSQGEYKIFFKK